MHERLTDTITDWLERTPGYTGYRALEDRRDDDRRLRESIAKSLDRTVQTLTGVSAKLAAARKLTHISSVERLVGATRLLADRVRTASYGYGGIFTERSVDEVALEQLRSFDAAFQREAASLDALANRLESAPEGPLDADITRYQDELNRLGRLFDARAEVVDSARPNKDATVLQMLEPGEEPRVSPLSNLKVGDAFSVEGEDYIADATISFTSGDLTVTLTRAGADESGADVWFVGGTTDSVPSSRLSETDGEAPQPAAGITARATVSTRDGSKSGLPAEYGYTGGTGTTASFWYSIGGETRAFSGTGIDDSDIQVYGQAT